MHNSQLHDRLKKELEVNVGLAINFSATNRYQIRGRGEMHIAILLENMRREGYEMQISQPHVITKKISGKLFEPFEEVTIDIPSEFSGAVIKKLSKRGGKMCIKMIPKLGYYLKSQLEDFWAIGVNSSLIPAVLELWLHEL